MADVKSMETLVTDLEKRIARLKAVDAASAKLDAKEFPQEAKALKATLRDPGKVDDAERNLAELAKAVEVRRQQKKRMTAVEQTLAGLDAADFPREVEDLKALLRHPAKADEAEKGLGALTTLVESTKWERQRLKAVGEALARVDTSEFPEEAEALRAILNDPSRADEAEELLEALGKRVRVRRDQRRRQRATEQAVTRLDAAEVPEETQALKALLKDPERVDDAERALKELQAATADRKKRRERLEAVRLELDRLDTPDFAPEAKAIRDILNDPTKADEAERGMAQLRESIKAEGQRRRARRLLDEGVSLGQRGAGLLAEGKHGEAQAPLRQSLERLAEAQGAVGDADARLLESIGANEKAVTGHLLSARLGEAIAQAPAGAQAYDAQEFDKAEQVFQRARVTVAEVQADARKQGLREADEAATQRLQELDSNIAACASGKEAKRVEQMVQEGNARWEEAERAVREKDLLKARELLDAGVKGLQDAFVAATKGGFQDSLPRINALRQRMQGRLEEVYDALASGVPLAQTSVTPIRAVTPRGPQVPGITPVTPATQARSTLPWDQLYEHVKLLGQGGFADVFLARRRADGLLVALKVPRGVMAGGVTLSDKLLQDFQQEAGNWALLRHPHIVLLHQSGDQPYPWLAMEVMTGGSLQSRLGKLPPRQALELFNKVCGALEYAHKGGVLHRDIKPENILFTEGGEPKVSDWGLARQFLYQSLSQHFSGTPLYSAPEQIEPERFGVYDHPGDVFQLGIVLYETLTGRHPFLRPGEELHQLSPLAVPRRITDPAYPVPPPSSVRADLPRALDEVALRALARLVRERYREVYLLREAIESLKGV